MAVHDVTRGGSSRHWAEETRVGHPLDTAEDPVVGESTRDHGRADQPMDETMTPTNLRTEIEEADRAFESNFGRHDADGMGSLYTEDGQLLPPGADVVSGRDDIAAFWQGVFDTGVANARLETVEVEDHGDTAIEVGRFTLRDADERTVDHGTFVVVWKHDDGAWRLHRDIWNSNTPDEG